MKVKLNTLVIWPLALLLVFVPVFCCCLASTAQAHGQAAGTIAKSRQCCDAQDKSQTKNNQLQHDSSKCECPNHIFVKAINIVSGGLEPFSFQDHLSSLQISFLALVLSSENPRDVSAFQVVHSPPLYTSNPLYIEFRTLRL